MSTRYRYKAKSPIVACWHCSKGFDVDQPWAADALSECVHCFAPVYRVIERGRQRFQFRHGMKGDMRDYREDLARFPGDPEAYVDGPRAVQKLWDKRRRQGWTRREVNVDDACASRGGDIDHQSLMEAAKREAAASNFDLNDPDIAGVVKDMQDRNPDVSE